MEVAATVELVMVTVEAFVGTALRPDALLMVAAPGEAVESVLSRPMTPVAVMTATVVPEPLANALPPVSFEHTAPVLSEQAAAVPELIRAVLVFTVPSVVRFPEVE